MRVLPRDDFQVSELAAGADPVDMAGSERFILILGEPPGGRLDLRRIGGFKIRYPGSLIVLLVDECPAEQRWAAEKLGVAGVLLKSISSDTFVASLRLVALGENVFSAPRGFAGAGALPDAPRCPGAIGSEDRLVAGDLHIGTAAGDPPGSGPPGLPAVALTDLEINILACLAAGQPNGVISRRFKLTKGAVEASLAAILAKTNAVNRSQAVQWALHDMDCRELALRIRAATPLSHG